MIYILNLKIKPYNVSVITLTEWRNKKYSTNYIVRGYLDMTIPHGYHNYKCRLIQVYFTDDQMLIKCHWSHRFSKFVSSKINILKSCKKILCIIFLCKKEFRSRIKHNKETFHQYKYLSGRKFKNCVVHETLFFSPRQFCALQDVQ